MVGRERYNIIHDTTTSVNAIESLALDVVCGSRNIDSMKSRQKPHNSASFALINYRLMIRNENG